MGIVKKIFSDKSLIAEVFRFGVVGGTCFLIDYIILWFVLHLVFKGAETDLSVGVSTACGFTVAVIANYLLSMFFVFNSKEQKENGKGAKSVVLFVILSLIGFFITWAIMRVGVINLKIHELFVKVFATAVVMIWNFISRKIFIFK